MSEIGVKVLLVDDEERSREGLAQWLRRKGFSVDTAASGEDALAKVGRTQNQYDAVLIDQVLPGMNGIATTQQIRDLDPEVMVIMMTAVNGCSRRTTLASVRPLVPGIL